VIYDVEIPPQVAVLLGFDPDIYHNSDESYLDGDRLYMTHWEAGPTPECT